MAHYIMAIDQGTTGTTVSIIDKQGQSVTKINQEYRQIYPQPGWVEHDPEDIWKSVLFCIEKSLESARLTGKDIAAIGITNQRETVVAWDRNTHKPVYNAIVWQCRRTTDFCERLKKAGHAKKINQKTGLVIDPYFSASKINWLLKNVKAARDLAKKGQLAVGTIDTFLIWRLTGGATHKTDVSNASRTQLLNIKTGTWDKDLLKLFQVHEDMLPTVTYSNGDFGKTQNVPHLIDGTPISGVAGDQQAALFGQTCFSPGQAKCTYGTGSFILMNIGQQLLYSKTGILTTVAWQLKGDKSLTYAFEGGAFICGAAVQWLRDGMEFFKKSAEVEQLAAQVVDTGGVEFVPALTGLGAPYWDPHARGTITGLTRGTKRTHLARATLESMALQNVDILESMQKDARKKLKDLRVDGGASANNLLMQMQADFMNCRILRPKMIETTSAGAAYLAGLGIGFWGSLKDIKSVWHKDIEMEPRLKAKLREQRISHWRQAVGQTMYRGGLQGLKRR